MTPTSTAPVTLSAADRASIAERERLDPVALRAGLADRRLTVELLALDVETDEATAYVLIELARAKAGAATAETLSAAADAASAEAAAMLAKAEAPVREQQTRIDDVQAAYAAAAAMPDPVHADLNRLAATIETYRRVLVDLDNRLIAPRDQAATAQREARLAREAAAEAAAAVDQCRAKLVDPRHEQTPARAAITRRTAIDVAIAISGGQAVHPVDREDAEAIIGDACQDLGIADSIRLLERQRVERLLRLPRGWEQHVPGGKP